MSALLFGLIVAICVVAVLWALLRPERFYLYPVLVALVVLGWVVPQLFILLDYPELPAAALPLTMTMIVLCIAATLLGWRRGRTAKRLLPARIFNDGRLLIGAVLLSLVGAYFRLAIRDLPADLLEMSQWSGPQTIYIFLARTQILGMALGWLVFLRSRSLLGLGITLFNLSFLLDAIFIGGRRGVIIEVGTIFMIGLFLTRRFVPPRLALLGGVLALTILFTVIGEYRNATSARTVRTDRIALAEAWENIKQIDFLASFKQTTQERDPRIMELYNATLMIGGTQESLELAGLGNYWNALVFQYVPGQIVGFDLKKSLMVSTSNPMAEVYGARAHTGTTITGFADAFRSFWFFGAFVFFGFAWMMRRCWERAMQGELLYQFLYLVLMKDALHAVTHSTLSFVASWPFIVLFSLPVFWFAYAGRSTAPASPSTSSTPGEPSRKRKVPNPS